MRELVIFRIFALFPLIGILIPDMANKFTSTTAHLSVERVIVEVTLSICVIISSAGIWVAENEALKIAE